MVLLNVGDKDRGLLVEELEQLGDIQSQSGDEKRYEVTLKGGVSADDIEAVMCFIIEPEQIEITTVAVEEAASAAEPATPVPSAPAEPSASEEKPAAPVAEKSTRQQVAC
ncbi:hypothetical protein HAALTHF_07550n [Vreelandella aquamarina]|nr:hypothetical protein HAALTHF_07550n [Halomonas axialensis]